MKLRTLSLTVSMVCCFSLAALPCTVGAAQLPGVLTEAKKTEADAKTGTEDKEKEKKYPVPKMQEGKFEEEDKDMLPLASYKLDNAAENIIRDWHTLGILFESWR